MDENDGISDEELPEAGDDAGQGDEPVEKTMAERAMEVGRDGAYLEVDAKDLIAAHRSGELQKAKIVVVKESRVELSDPADVKNLVQSVTAVVMQIASENPQEFVGMSDEQASMWAFKAIFTGGLS